MDFGGRSPYPGRVLWISRRGILLAFVGIGAWILGSVPGASAQNGCSAYCDPEFRCRGGCSIVPPSGCGAVCATTGCTAYCRLLGPGEECRDITVVECRPLPPKFPEPALPPADWNVGDWAIVEVQGASDGPASTKTIAASSPSFADAAIQRFLDGMRTSFKIRLPERSTWFLVAPAAPCVEFQAELRGPAPHAPNLAQSKIYIVGETNGKGALVNVKVLYSTDPHWAAGWVDLLKKTLNVRSESVPGRPLRFFGSFIADPTGRVGFTVSGATVVGP